MKRIQLLATPRNISTALMYSFENRKDTSVVDEPFYAYYLFQTGKNHPGKETVLKSQSADIKSVKKYLLSDNYDHEILFIKNMVKHFLDQDYSFLHHFSNVISIRNPRLLITSLAKIIENPQMNDIGLEVQFKMYHYLKKVGHPVLVLDTGELLKDPQKVLKILCEQLDIPFRSAMLNWNPGPRKEDGIWAKYWYKNVHKSTGFKKQDSSSDPLLPQYEDLYLAAKKYYDILHDHSIKA